MKVQDVLLKAREDGMTVNQMRQKLGIANDMTIVNVCRGGNFRQESISRIWEMAGYRFEDELIEMLQLLLNPEKPKQ